MPAAPSRKLFVNLPVQSLDKAIEFFTTLGFSFDPRFTDERATCMVVGEDAFVMLLVEDFFKGFTTKDLNDTATTAEAILAVFVDRREQVDELVDAALAAGARLAGQVHDHPFMYSRSFLDLDGHMWELGWMDQNFDPSAG